MWKLASAAMAISLVALLVHALAFPDLPQYQGKGIGWRIGFYGLSAVLVPFVWLAVGARPYPYVIATLVILPFVIDTLGNALNLYDTISWFDDVMHAITWIPWTMSFGLALHYAPSLPRWAHFAVTFGYGVVTRVFWELLEYVAFIRDNPREFETAYTDTLGDLILSMGGSLIGAVLVATVLWRAGRRLVEPAGARDHASASAD